MMRLINICLLFIVVGFYSCDKNKNEPPVIVDVIPKITKTTVEKEIRFTCNVSDEDEMLLSYIWTSSCGSFTDGMDKKSARWQAPGEEGTCSIAVTVSDGEYSVDHSAFKQFLLGKVLDPPQSDDARRIEKGELTTEEAFSYSFEVDDDRNLSRLIIRNIHGETDSKKIYGALRWTFGKINRG